MEQLQTPSPSHIEFDQMCSQLEDFEPLPSVAGPLEREPQDEEETSLDAQILVGLVLAL